MVLIASVRICVSERLCVQSLCRASLHVRILILSERVCLRADAYTHKSYAQPERSRKKTRGITLALQCFSLLHSTGELGTIFYSIEALSISWLTPRQPYILKRRKNFGEGSHTQPIPYTLKIIRTPWLYTHALLYAHILIISQAKTSLIHTTILPIPTHAFFPTWNAYSHPFHAMQVRKKIFFSF